MNVIELNQLEKTYKEADIEVKAVRGVSLEITQGEFTAIVGPSGSGKTTLLNLIGGLDNPTAGSIKIANQEMSQLTPRQLTDFRLNNIGFIFQAYNLIPVLTAKENTQFVMQLQGRPKQECENRATELLKAVGLGERMDARPAKMSGGQQQRVAVARALAAKPKFILADEPTANLDSESTENLLNIMEELNRQENITFVFSTHDSRVVKKARRVITLEDGKIVSDVRKE